MSEHWESVTVLHKRPSKQTNPNSQSVVNAARRRGVPIDTQKKFGSGSNRHEPTTNTAAVKLDRETEELKHKKIPLDVGKLIMQGRQAKDLSQKELAVSICEKQSVISDYEAGRGIPNNVILGKIERIIGLKLRGKDRGQPLTVRQSKK